MAYSSAKEHGVAVGAGRRWRRLVALFAMLVLAAFCSQANANARQASDPLGSKRQADAALFVLDRFLNENNELNDVRAFYGESVFYFDQGVQSRQEVLEDKRAYFERWPSRSFNPDLTTLRAKEISGPDGRTDVEVEVEVEFEVSGPERSASGRSVVMLVVARRGGQFIILSEGGRVISRR